MSRLLDEVKRQLSLDEMFGMGRPKPNNWEGHFAAGHLDGRRGINISAGNQTLGKKINGVLQKHLKKLPKSNFGDSLDAEETRSNIDHFGSHLAARYSKEDAYKLAAHDANPKLHPEMAQHLKRFHRELGQSPAAEKGYHHIRGAVVNLYNQGFK